MDLKITKKFNDGYQLLVKGGEILQHLILLFFRVTWGWALFKTGKGKLLHHDNVVNYFTTLNIPLPELNAWFVSGLECIGGLLLFVGLASRPIGLLLSINMLVAYISVETDRNALIGVFSDYNPFVEADPFFFLLTSLLVLAFGPGVISLDYLLAKKFNKNV